MSFKQRFVAWLLIASISGACQARLLRMSNQLTSAAVGHRLYNWDSLLASSATSAQYILPSFCEQCEGNYVTTQIPNQPDFSATPRILPFVSAMSVVATEYDEANQLLLMTTVRGNYPNETICYSFNLLSKQAEDFLELSMTGPDTVIVPYYTLVHAVCVPGSTALSASTLSSTLAHPPVSGATSYSITAVIPSPYMSLTLVAIANQSDPDNPPNNIQMNTTSVLGSPAREDSIVAITSNSFSHDNQAPFVAVVYVTEDNTAGAFLQQIDTIVSPPAFGNVLDLDPIGHFPPISDLQLATQSTGSGTDWVVFILVNDVFNNSFLYNFTVTSCVANCPSICSSTPCLMVNGGQTSRPNYIASWNSLQAILSANKFSILDKADASISFTSEGTDKIYFWETNENGNFPVENGGNPTSIREVFVGPLLYDVANNNLGGMVVAFGEGDGRINLAIRCNSTTDFVYDVIYYDDIYGADEGFARVALSNGCNDAYVGAFAAAPLKDGGAIALYSAP